MGLPGCAEASVLTFERQAPVCWVIERRTRLMRARLVPARAGAGRFIPIRFEPNGPSLRPLMKRSRGAFA